MLWVPGELLHNHINVSTGEQLEELMCRTRCISVHPHSCVLFLNIRNAWSVPKIVRVCINLTAEKLSQIQWAPFLSDWVDTMTGQPAVLHLPRNYQVLLCPLGHHTHTSSTCQNQASTSHIFTLILWTLLGLFKAKTFSLVLDRVVRVRIPIMFLLPSVSPFRRYTLSKCPFDHCHWDWRR